MRTRAGWLALVITGGLALAPAPLLAQQFGPGVGSTIAEPGGLDIGRESPVIPLPIYHARPETGGFYTAAEFILWRMGRNIAPQQIATRGFVDVDGSVQRDLNGTFLASATVGAPAIFVPGN